MDNKLEERFAKEFPPEVRKNNKDYIEISSYATTPERILAFIERELASERAQVVREAELCIFAYETGFNNLEATPEEIEGMKKLRDWLEKC